MAIGEIEESATSTGGTTGNGRDENAMGQEKRPLRLKNRSGRRDLCQRCGALRSSVVRMHREELVNAVEFRKAHQSRRAALHDDALADGLRRALPGEQQGDRSRVDRLDRRQIKRHVARVNGRDAAVRQWHDIGICQFARLDLHGYDRTSLDRSEDQLFFASPERLRSVMNLIKPSMPPALIAWAK